MRSLHLPSLPPTRVLTSAFGKSCIAGQAGTLACFRRGRLGVGHFIGHSNDGHVLQSAMLCEAEKIVLRSGGTMAMPHLPPRTLPQRPPVGTSGSASPVTVATAVLLRCAQSALARGQVEFAQHQAFVEKHVGSTQHSPPMLHL
eukprot:1983490-Rhodomonas_salina.2